MDNVVWLSLGWLIVRKGFWYVIGGGRSGLQPHSVCVICSSTIGNRWLKYVLGLICLFPACPSKASRNISGSWFRASSVLPKKCLRFLWGKYSVTNACRIGFISMLELESEKWRDLLISWLRSKWFTAKISTYLIHHPQLICEIPVQIFRKPSVPILKVEHEIQILHFVLSTT